MRKVMKSFDDKIKLGQHNIEFLTSEEFKFITGRYTAKNAEGDTKDVSKEIYKKISHNCCFVILGIGDAHFMMTGFKHSVIDYGYWECRDYWGTIHRFVEQNGIIKQL